MYGFFTELAGGEGIEVPGGEDFSIDCHGIIQSAARYGAKIIFLCNPNNPTGKAVRHGDIKKILTHTRAVVVVDEAYYEFHGETVIRWVYEYPNLIVLRTLSKAMALAGMRIGYLAADSKIMGYLRRVKSPYNVNALSQLVACRVLEEERGIKEWLDTFRRVRNQFVSDLGTIEGVKVYPTQANFVLFQVRNAHRIWQGLAGRGILVRKFRDSMLKDCLRVTVGHPGENSIFLRELMNCIKEE